MSDEDTKSSIVKKEETFIHSRTNSCKSDNQQMRTIELTDENAPNFAGTASFVGWKGRVDYALNHLEKDSPIDAGLLPRLLENAISTVILSAGGGTPPDDYFLTTILYLGCIRNEFGEHPPNIAGFLEHLKAKAPQKVLSTLESVQTKQLRKYL